MAQGAGMVDIQQTSHAQLYLKRGAWICDICFFQFININKMDTYLKHTLYNFYRHFITLSFFYFAKLLSWARLKATGKRLWAKNVDFPIFQYLSSPIFEKHNNTIFASERIVQKVEISIERKTLHFFHTQFFLWGSNAPIVRWKAKMKNISCTDSLSEKVNFLLSLHHLIRIILWLLWLGSLHYKQHQ